MIRKAYYSIETGRASVRAGYSRENDAQIVELNVRGYGIDLLPSDALKIASALTLAAEAAIRTDDDAASERVTHPEPLSSRSSKPKLVLPLQFGKKYQLTYPKDVTLAFDDDVDGVYEAKPHAVRGCANINGWLFDVNTGVEMSETAQAGTLEGPIEG